MNRDKLIIKVFHVHSVEFSEHTKFSDGVLQINPHKALSALKEERFVTSIKEIHLHLLSPYERNFSNNSIMDVIPISTKVLGQIGYGITHTLSGIVLLLTGVDEIGQQIGEFGNSSGNLSEKVHWGCAGTPKKEDFLLIFDIVVYQGKHIHRTTIDLCHEACDNFLQEIRESLKKLPGISCDEKREFFNSPPSLNSSKKKIVILKQVAGQGAMYDTRIFPTEPSGYKGGYSIIDCMNMPVFLSPNEYRDGAIRAMH